MKAKVPPPLPPKVSRFFSLNYVCVCVSDLSLLTVLFLCSLLSLGATKKKKS